MEYMEKLVSGSQKEKTALCFNMIDAKKQGYFTLADLSQLVKSINMTNTSDSEQTEILSRKVNQIASYLFQRFDSRGTGKVNFEEFNDAIMDDPQLLEIFTLLNKGIYEHFITKTLEEGRRHWFMNKTKYISMSLTECLNLIEGKNGVRTFREVSRPYLDSNFIEIKEAGMSPEQEHTQLQKVRSANSFVDISEKGGLLVTPLQNSISCTPGMFLDGEKKKKKKGKADPATLYEANPIQEFEIIAEEVRTDQVIRGLNTRRNQSPESQGNLQSVLPRALNLSPLNVEDIEGKMESQENSSDDEIFGTVGENAKVLPLPHASTFFMKQNLTKMVPPVSDKFNEFNVNLVSLVYDFEEKNEEKQSIHSSALLNPSQINMKIGYSSIPNSARIEKSGLKPSSISMANQVQSVHKSTQSPESQQFQFFRKNPLLPPSPSSRDPNFVLKGKIRDLIHHTEQIYQKMVLEKNKTDKK